MLSTCLANCVRNARRLVVVCLLIPILIGSVPPANAETSKAVTPSNDVIVIPKQLPVHVQPDANSQVVAEMLQGMVSHTIKVQKDAKGTTWVYLRDGAYGWVQVEAFTERTLANFSTDTLQVMVNAATNAVKTNPNDLDSYILLGTLHESLRNYAQATQDFQAAVKLAPNDGRLNEYLGKAALYNKQFGTAILYIGQAIKLNRKLAATYELMGLAQYTGGSLRDATSYFTQAIAIAPGYGILYSDRADTEPSADAIKDFTKAIQSDPNLALAYTGRGRLYQESGQYDKAMADLNQAIDIDPYCGTCYVNRGVYYSEVSGDEKTAFKDFDDAIAADPYNSDAYANRGASYLNFGQLDLALADLKTAVDLDNHNGYALKIYGTALAYAGQYQDAARHYRNSMGWPGGRVSTNLYLGQVYIALADYDNAIGAINNFFSGTNDNPGSVYFFATAHIVLGEAYLYKHQYTLAAKEYQAAFKTSRPFAKAYATQGGGYRVTPRRGLLIADLKQKITANPKDTDSQWQLGTLYMEFGQWQQAIKSYQSYLKLAGKAEPELQAFLAQLAKLIK